MKQLLFPTLLLLSAALAGCGRGGDEGSLNNISAQSDGPASSSSRPNASSNSSASNTQALQESLKTRIEAALASDDPQEFLNLFYLEDIEAEHIDETESGAIAPIYEQVVDDISFEAADDNYERFDIDYRYTPNLEVLGEVTLHFDDPDPNVSTSKSFEYGLIAGEYQLGHAKREFMQYDGPRNQQLSYSIFGQASPDTNQFHVTVSYQVIGLTRTIDEINDAGARSLFPGQYIETITVDQIVGNADFYFQIFENNELIYTSQTANNGDTIQYVNTDN